MIWGLARGSCTAFDSGAGVVAGGCSARVTELDTEIAAKAMSTQTL